MAKNQQHSPQVSTDASSHPLKRKRDPGDVSPTSSKPVAKKLALTNGSSHPVDNHSNGNAIISENDRNNISTLLKNMDPTSTIISKVFESTDGVTPSHPPISDLLQDLKTPLSYSILLTALAAINTSLGSNSIPARVSSHDLVATKALRKEVLWVQSAITLVEGLRDTSNSKGYQGKLDVVNKEEGEPAYALFQKIPSVTGTKIWFTNPVEGLTKEDVKSMSTGYASFMQVHQPTSASQDVQAPPQPTLGTLLASRKGKMSHTPYLYGPKVKEIPVRTIYDPFGSFGPAYDSTNATMSYTRSYKQSISDRLGEAFASSSSSTLAPPLSSTETSRVVVDPTLLEIGSGTDQTLDEHLKKNWKLVETMRQMQEERLLKGIKEPDEVESELAATLEASLHSIASRRPYLPPSDSTSSPVTLVPSTISSDGGATALYSSLAAPRLGWRGNLDPTRPYAVKDNSTLRIFPMLPTAAAAAVARPGLQSTPSNGSAVGLPAPAATAVPNTQSRFQVPVMNRQGSGSMPGTPVPGAGGIPQGVMGWKR